MKKIFTLGFGVFLMTQITAQNPVVSTNPYQSKVTTTNTKTTEVTEENTSTEKKTSISSSRTAVVSADATTTVEANKETSSSVIGISLPGFEEVVKDINTLLDNYATSTTRSDDKLNIKKLASKYEDMLNAELKKNKSLTETQKTDIENQIINIQTYK